MVTRAPGRAGHVAKRVRHVKLGFLAALRRVHLLFQAERGKLGEVSKRPLLLSNANLVGALQLAAFSGIPEVCLYFDSKLYRGCRVSKVHTSAMAAFDSPNFRPLVVAGIRFVFSPEIRSPPSLREGLRVCDNFEPRMSILRIFPGLFTTTAAELAGLRGLVLQTFGEGNAPNNQPYLLDTLKGAIERGTYATSSK